MSSPFRLWQKWYTLHTSCSVGQIGPNTVSQSVGSHECVTKNVNIFFWRGGCDLSERVQWTERGSGSLFLPVQLHKAKKTYFTFIKPSYSIEDILLLLQFRLIQTYLFKITKSYSTKFGNSSAIFNITQKQLLHCQENSAGLSKMFTLDCLATNHYFKVLYSVASSTVYMTAELFCGKGCPIHFISGIWWWKPNGTQTIFDLAMSTIICAYAFLYSQWLSDVQSTHTGWVLFI